MTTCFLHENETDCWTDIHYILKSYMVKIYQSPDEKNRKIRDYFLYIVFTMLALAADGTLC
jgi:hypothetical protein